MTLTSIMTGPEETRLALVNYLDLVETLVTDLGSSSSGTK